MSPYLFTLVMEVLTLMVQRRIERSNHFKYHWACKEIKLAQLCFADDLLMLCNGDYKSVEILKEGLMEFSKTSGLIPNMNKSAIFFGSVKEIEKKRILEVMPFKVGKLPMKYLGVPLVTKNIGIAECNHLVERVKQKVNDWKNKALSYAGRLQLIASVLASMHIYWASVFLIPKTTVKEIEKALKGFLWCQGDMKRGAARVAWKVICSPKSQGGLGIKSLGPWNEALLCKHLWNIVDNKESLWVKWVNVIKLKGKSIWEIQCEEKDSGTWKAILNLRCPLCDLIPFRSRYEARLGEGTKIADMIVNNEWKWLEVWKTEFSNISRIKVPKLEDGNADYAIWKDNNGVIGKFSTKKVWEKLKEMKDEVQWHKAVWFSQCNPRQAFILWNSQSLFNSIEESIKLQLLSLKVKKSLAVMEYLGVDLGRPSMVHLVTSDMGGLIASRFIWWYTQVDVPLGRFQYCGDEWLGWTWVLDSSGARNVANLEEPFMVCEWGYNLHNDALSC
ncbi:RNA-directed DNA polymerase, eukaryota, reverse transcriptase zinc-binding domain protein [Tanacetum coccineum]|uniref:RNA-directed DNA polymerase, eukaryota, reverse transcriptase zinc-binding domain protein n=1 Tax=Tanacetum coccineum TaxID=301880 RepID=A0ABQ5H7G1_9ASTR